MYTEWMYQESMAHSGIKGQKWGVRRYQNLDRTWTEAGKERYGRHSIASRAGLNKQETKECLKLGKSLYQKAIKEEPTITKDVTSIVKNTSGKMYGLNHKIKTLNSISAKIGAEAKEKEIPFSSASKEIKDAVRYTVVSNNDDFVNNYGYLKSELSKRGYTETKCKNYFDLYNQGKVKHKSVQCNYSNPDGYIFEIQFQTPESQKAKDLKVPIYEERRKIGISNQRAKELERKMEDLAEQVPDPKNINKIKSH